MAATENVGVSGAADVAAAARAGSEAQVVENAAEFSDWIVSETGAADPKAGVELYMAEGIQNQSAAMLTELQGIVLPVTPDARVLPGEYPTALSG